MQEILQTHFINDQLVARGASAGTVTVTSDAQTGSANEVVNLSGTGVGSDQTPQQATAAILQFLTVESPGCPG